MAISFAAAPSGGSDEQTYSFEDIADRLAACALEVCKDLLPGGRVAGREYVCADLDGGRGESLSVNLNDGVWKDFAAGEGGADLINLFARKFNLSNGAAKDRAAEWLGLATPSAPGPRHVSELGERVERAAHQDDWWRAVKASKVWDYLDADGAIFASVMRWDHPVKDKVIRPWDPEAKLYRVPDGPRPLLYLPELTARPRDPIVIGEGEKSADALVEAGLLGTTIMGGAQAIAKTDWEALRGRVVVLWRDNDAAGRSWEEKVVEAIRAVDPAAVHVVEIPADKPRKWDAADAEPAERIALVDGALACRAVVTGRPPLRLLDWAADTYLGEPPPRRFLVREVFPLGVTGVLAAMGDTGKGMKLLDLSLKVAGSAYTANTVMQAKSFGCTVDEEGFGRAVILSAEDNRAELHRRMDRLDPDRAMRKKAADRLLVVPMPNAGGAASLIRSTSRGVDVTDDFKRLLDQLLELDELKLVVIDPLSSFVQADLNKDSAAVAYLFTELGMVAEETGALILCAHHMRKIGNASSPITRPEQARDAIRGVSGIVDGPRVSYAVWPTDQKDAIATLLALGKDAAGDTWRNRVYRGAVVKSNGPADKTVRTYVRDADTGLLIDWTDNLARAKGDEKEEAIDLRARFVLGIEVAAALGHPFMMSGENGVYEKRHQMPLELRESPGRTALQTWVKELLDEGKLVQVRYRKGQSGAKWLDVPKGRFAEQLVPLEPGPWRPELAEECYSGQRAIKDLPFL